MENKISIGLIIAGILLWIIDAATYRFSYNIANITPLGYALYGISIVMIIAGILGLLKII